MKNTLWRGEAEIWEDLIDRAVRCIQGVFPMAETWIRQEGFWLSVDDFECKHFQDKLPKLLGALTREVKKMRLNFTVQYT
ncbi:MAG: hypothetical protein LBM93_05660, partial [Oscillospiraceae bacterium]|nr:hypothetical protein [Oscillospiraceae bacterium]